jgi:hypothetical protein
MAAEARLVDDAEELLALQLSLELAGLEAIRRRRY